MPDQLTAPQASTPTLQAPAADPHVGSQIYSRKRALLAGAAGLGLAGLGVGIAPGLLNRATGRPMPHPRADLVSHPDRRPAASPALLRRLIAGTQGFGFDLFGRLVARPGAATRNVFISPLSIAAALAMTYNGARGATAAGMAAALGLDGLSLDEVNAGYATLLPLLTGGGPAVRATVADSLWARDGITLDPAFTRRVTAAYHAQLTTLDFRAPDASATINAWVRARTNGLIDGVVPDRLPRDAILYLINAVYFKGRWASPFDRALTRPQVFTRGDGDRASVPMMVQGGDFPYYQGGGFQAIRLPYGAGHTAMIVVLPDKGTDLARVQASLTAPGFDGLVSRLAMSRGTIFLPRFAVNYTSVPNLNGPLIALGMGRAFRRDAADFNAMFQPPRPIHPYISEVAHKAVMHVDEKGTTAAAVTSVGMAHAGAVAANQFTMVVDRPFFCAIREGTTGAILFMGQITDPQPA